MCVCALCVHIASSVGMLVSRERVCVHVLSSVEVLVSRECVCI